MTEKEDMILCGEIAKRSEAMGIGFGSRITRVMDIDFAHRNFYLDLEKFLKAENQDFAHDFLGIQANIDRPNHQWKDTLFVPRFVKK